MGLFDNELVQAVHEALRHIHQLSRTIGRVVSVPVAFHHRTNAVTEGISDVVFQTLVQALHEAVRRVRQIRSTIGRVISACRGFHHRTKAVPEGISYVVVNALVLHEQCMVPPFASVCLLVTGPLFCAEGLRGWQLWQRGLG
jgi:glycerol-3-phosphate dehydrogenase